MSEDSGNSKKLSLSGGKLTLNNIDASKLRSGPAIGGARKTVQVEVRRKRAPSAMPRVQVPEATAANTPESATPYAGPQARLMIDLLRRSERHESAPCRKV